MARTKLTGTLELEEDLQFQQWQWRIASALWLSLVVLMIATALGLFGGGLLSRARGGVPGGPLWAEYERVTRFGATAPLTVYARTGADGTIRITFDSELLQAFRVRDVTPPPDAAVMVTNGVEYRYQAPGTGVAVVAFELDPVERGLIRGEIRSPASSVRLTQLILP
jgi:hypothetical protein